jgi:hypothetical protein
MMGRGELIGDDDGDDGDNGDRSWNASDVLHYRDNEEREEDGKDQLVSCSIKNFFRCADTNGVD